MLINESYDHIVFLEVKKRAEARVALILINTLEFALSDKCPYLIYVPCLILNVVEQPLLLDWSSSNESYN